ncbi:MAG TPA: beta-ketoacyl synthase N-terminal-like domain-containing protein, partial [Sphingobacterium sp.]|nr:beta-ketoacyl synthase N-terminal-like domain-containing protein [Sphingobacterium sp.]
MELKRVVVTGLGALTPIGNTVTDYWDSLVAGVSGAAPITHFDASKFKTQFACEVKGFDPLTVMDRKEARKVDPFVQYAIASTDEAVKDANLNFDELNRDRIGVIWGAGIGGLTTFTEEIVTYSKGDGTPRFNPFFIPKMLIDIAPGHISMRHGLRGPNFSAVSACVFPTHISFCTFKKSRSSQAARISLRGLIIKDHKIG